ncbi:MAG: NAD(P)-binding domain-containing protein [Burkholderiales bacterium]|nr:NAD(P)-binding domain-containing protein [Burkholderiales bacterium]
MRIGIIGSGVVARTLAAGFIQHGHEVTLGTRDASKLADFALATPGARVDSSAGAAAFGDVVVLAVKGGAALQAARDAGAGLDGKPVLDATNPIADTAPVDGVLPYFTGKNESLMEWLQEAHPKARFVKAFNSVGAGRMVDPDFGGTRPTMFIAGNDAEAKATATTLLAQLGWDTADMGSAAAARAIEPLAMLWCIPGFRDGSWMHAFKLLR